MMWLWLIVGFFALWIISMMVTAFAIGCMLATGTYGSDEGWDV
ncbi:MULTISPECIES: hypothetical protein [Neisseria]|nr:MULTISPECIES: hypothetical protein [Neisseria]